MEGVRMIMYVCISLTFSCLVGVIPPKTKAHLSQRLQEPPAEIKVSEASKLVVQGGEGTAVPPAPRQTGTSRPPLSSSRGRGKGSTASVAGKIRWKFSLMYLCICVVIVYTYQHLTLFYIVMYSCLIDPPSSCS